LETPCLQDQSVSYSKLLHDLPAVLEHNKNVVDRFQLGRAQVSNNSVPHLLLLLWFPLVSLILNSLAERARSKPSTIS
jgi:hypothetical protein